MTRVLASRLVIAERIVRRDHLQGTWWPRSADIEAELPPMLERARSRVHAVFGLTLNRDDWPGAPMVIPQVPSRTPRISWYGLDEPHLVLLHVSGPTRIALLLLPPETPDDVAVRAMLMSTTPGNCLSTTQTLALARERADAKGSPETV